MYVLLSVLSKFSQSFLLLLKLYNPAAPDPPFFISPLLSSVAKLH